MDGITTQTTTTRQKPKAKWLLFVSPWESSTGQWELSAFNSLSASEKEIRRRDLTKEHYLVRNDRLIEIVRAHCERIEKSGTVCRADRK
jgi:hypothetical protein